MLVPHCQGHDNEVLAVNPDYGMVLALLCDALARRSRRRECLDELLATAVMVQLETFRGRNSPNINFGIQLVKGMLSTLLQHEVMK